MSQKRAFLHKLLVFLLATGASVNAMMADESGLSAKFHSSDEWSGADGAYSISMGDKTLWLFGDSFIGTISGGTREGNVMIHNSLAVQDNKTGKFVFYWTKGKSPASYFSEDEKSFFWPGDGIFQENKVYLFAKKVEVLPGKSSDPFGFCWTADELIVIDNPGESPDFWQFRRARISASNREYHLGCACIVDSDYLYVLGMKEKAHQAFLARIKLTELHELNLNAFEFLATRKSGPVWSRKIQDAGSLWDNSAAEGSLLKVKNGFVSIYHDKSMGADIVFRQAKSLEGPWSDQKLLYRIPEAELKRGFCYAGKAHPEQNPGKDGKLTLSYAINPGTMEAHSKDPDAYFPKLVTVEMPDLKEDDNSGNN